MNVPKLRFQEFSGEWQEKTFRDIVSLNLVPVEKPTTDYIRLGIRSHCKGTFHELVKIENLLEADKMFLVPRNNLILNITFAWEHAIAITDEDDEGKYVSGRFPTFAFKEKEYPSFYDNIIRSKRMKYELGVASPGGAGRNRVLNKELFLDIPVHTTKFEEQYKISEFIKCVDEKIKNQQAVVESLEEQKKGLMKKIFSQELRFKDDYGKEFPAWEEKKLGEVLNVCSGKDYKHLESGNVPVFGTGGYMLSVNEWLYDGETVCIGRKGTINLPLYHKGKIWTVDTLFYTQNFRNVLPKFVYYLFLNIDWLKHNEATGVPSLSKSIIENINVMVPSDEKEQKAIVDFFSCFDEKIEKEKFCVEHWQQIKKGLLQQMFV